MDLLCIIKRQWILLLRQGTPYFGIEFHRSFSNEVINKWPLGRSSAKCPGSPQWPPSHTTLTDNLTVSFPAHSSPRLCADGVECKIKQ